MTNFEKIKADIQVMTVEEFANYIEYLFACEQCNYYEDGRAKRCQLENCIKGHIKWLESEVEE